MKKIFFVILISLLFFSVLSNSAGFAQQKQMQQPPPSCAPAYIMGTVTSINPLDSAISIKNNMGKILTLKISPYAVVNDMSKPYGPQCLSNIKNIKPGDNVMVMAQDSGNVLTAACIMFTPKEKQAHPSWEQPGQLYPQEQDIKIEDYLEDIYGKIISCGADTITIEFEDLPGKNKTIKINESTKIYDCSKPYGEGALIKIQDIKIGGLIMIIGEKLTGDLAKTIYYSVNEESIHQSWNSYFEKLFEEQEK